MAVLSVALVISSALRKPGADGDRVDWAKAGRALTTWLALAASVAAIKLIGFVTSFALLTFFVAAVMYRRPVRLAVTVAVASAAGFYVLFPLALGVPLPAGVLGF